MIKETLLEPTADTRASLDSCTPRRSTALLVLTGLWLIIFFAALFTPPLLDDADATHASAARHMALSGDLVTLRVDGIRYLEKAPLPYWLGALSFRLFGFNSFAAHLPQTIGVLLLALLGYYWAYRAFNARAAFYTGLATLTTIGVFLFTRYYIPEVLLSLFLAIALFCLLRSLQTDQLQGKKSVISTGGGALAAAVEKRASRSVPYAYIMWTALALAVLTKGLVALVFFFGAAIVYLALSGEYKNWRSLKPFTGILLFLLIAAPWHILAGLRNTGGMNGHGFFWFYFINEHVLRFLGRRYPKDYNKLPGYLFWSLHLVWLFPWSLFCGTLFRQAYLAYQRYRASNPAQIDEARTFYWQPYAVVVVGLILQNAFKIPYIFTLFLALILFLLHGLRRRQSNSPSDSPLLRVNTLAQRSTLLLSIFASLVLVFFSLSTNQEYYTFPAYLSMILLLAVALAHAEQTYSTDSGSRRWITVGHATFTVLGVAIAITLIYGLWISRHLPFVPDIGDLLAHRGVGDYTLSMSGIFDLTGPSFAALRLPATLAAIAFLIGPAIAWLLRSQRRHLAATAAVAITATSFFIAAHIAFARFAPMLSSKSFADTIQQLEADHSISRDNKVIFYGDQSYGSSITFYLGRQIYLVNGRASSMLFGGTFPDAPPVFLTPEDLLNIWGQGERKLLFVPLEKRDAVDQLLGTHKVLLFESSGKALFTDRPLDNPGRTP
ncbi:ArnT family glycosyltransferase [Tunturibacter empetritectus]|uniref:4-amino-4-deoxy-L-arabinose transferase-like glycosyltransferase n=1 Tax=Tunturiibacter lichenicola TaxID=2051959 RepID=A0A7W8N2Y8_9BACT|nr:glycosyltransferase family 39 protein [Edaphobacter lichenicola]MBB5342903.1 4-amino-4-deoxy-L-arabinose transferase-like glycosyltransferase [Edaphobacter lichenicola]